MMNLRKAVVVAAAAFALGALAAPASAATQNAAAVGPQTSASGMHATPYEVTAARSSSVSPAFSACPVTAFGYDGAGICGTQGLTVYDSNGNPVEAFVIGTDWAIWHAWPGSNGWHSLGGVAEHSTANGVGLWSASPYAIWTYGTHHIQYCDNWGTPKWGGWHTC